MLIARFSCLTFVITLLVLQGCSSTPLTPSQTAQHFWEAMLLEDADVAAQYATGDSVPVLEKNRGEFKQAAVSFGQVSIQSDRANIETALRFPSEKNSQPFRFNTTLIKDKQNWKVDFVTTRGAYEQSKQKRGLSKLVDDLSQFGHKFSGQLNETLKHWDEASPQIKKDLENLGESVQKDLQSAIDKYGPELQDNLQEFTESLDDALKELQKHQPGKPQDMPEQEKPEKEQSQNTEPKGRLI